MQGIIGNIIICWFFVGFVTVALLDVLSSFEKALNKILLQSLKFPKAA